ncbi:MAG: prolipoprotein diacylglyceryl transferase, partial [Paracoccaceae bacterium]
MQAMIPFPDISPEIFTVTVFGADFALRWYALAYIVGILIGWQLVVRTAKAPRLWPGNKPTMTPTQVEDFLTWAIIGIILGGRLGYVLFYQFGYYMQNPAQILRIWEGGMAFHGGMLGVIVAGWLYTGRHNIPR